MSNKKNLIKKNVFRGISLVISVLLLVFTVNYFVFAWTEPSATPPGNNTEAPINASGIAQYISNALGLGGVFETDTDTHLAINGGNVGIGTTTPQAKLDVVGLIKSEYLEITKGVKITDGTQGAGKVLTSDASGLASWQTVASGAVPSGAVMFFNLASCPSGWTELTSARGRYIVGLPSGGTLGGTVGTGLTNLQNRAVGQHTHGMTGVWGNWYSNSGYLGIPGAMYTTAGAVGTNGVSGGAVAGTNAPYIQLLACQKG